MPISTLLIRIKEEWIAKLIITVGMVTLSVGGNAQLKCYNRRLRSTDSMRLRKTSGPLKPPYGYNL
ncbi:hypothetical protein Hanom_Chr02g00099811 [Helianthus anomalus]